MGKYKNKIAFVVATKDRPSDLLKLLQSLSGQTHQPDQVIIVDSSKIPVRSITKDFQTLNIKYIHHPEPSAAAQRNVGVKAVDLETELVGFLDDDVILEKQALEAMLEFWKTASEDLGGCAFNLMNPPSTSGTKLKATALVKWLGLYSREKGVVMPSGWQTLTGTVSETIFVDWLPSTAAVWRSEIFNNFSFDDFFDGYSYLEDLDFSYSVAKKYKLAVVADAKYWHHPSSSERVGPYLFGKKEAINRLYFVRKNKELSLPLCYLAIILRAIANISSGILKYNKNHFKRAWGNCVGIVDNVNKTKKPINAKASFVGERVKKIVILATAMGMNDRGIGQYEKHLLRKLLPLLTKQNCQVILITSNDAEIPFSNNFITHKKLPAKRDNSIQRFLSEQFFVLYFCLKADVFISLETVFPFFPLNAKRKMTVVHDIHVFRHIEQPEKYPEDYTWKYKVWARKATEKAINSSHRIITVSNFTRNEVQQVFSVPPDRIVFIPNAVDHKYFYPIKKMEKIKRKYNLPESFYLFVGPYSRKKNLRIIVETYSFGQFQNRIFLPVLIVGDMRRSKLYTETMSLINQMSEKRKKLFRFIGFVPDEDLPLLYSASKAFIYPSLYEGFGLPVLEAMACGTPVIASERSSIPEVTEDSALLIDPDKAESLIEALEKINQVSIREILIKKGLKRAKEFSWIETAEKMVQTILS